MTEQERQTYVEPASEFEDIEVDAPLVGIVMGSKSDMPAMEAAEQELRRARDQLRGAGDVRPPRARRWSPTTRATPGCAGCA